ncbi:hypothetical protein SPI_03770 [Niveomyces insectorum RCEF 264]|uniref:Uncharacterized protein n=1 Tax=Niveomyces insectorum RCEF 264 TaxID=1081102 RepID=A0A167WCB8_9HYPO|nr:hypothetical protein SPI_03770 [Niveomyces insectorum RCEF 264]
MAAATSTTTTTATKASSKRFELPALEFKFSSLTDGTDIPPPPPSPIAEEPLLAKAEVPQPTASKTGASTNGAAPPPPSSSSKTNGATADTVSSPTRSLLTREGRKRPADDVPASPTLSSRPGSIRRLFSRSLLNTAYANAEAEGGHHHHHQASPDGAVAAGSIMTRPDSRSNGSFMDERRSRRSSGWFRRLRGSGTGGSADSYNGSIAGDAPASKRTSTLLDDVQPVQAAPKPRGPPPPMIPELGPLETKIDLDSGGGLGSDLFKNIN